MLHKEKLTPCLQKVFIMAEREGVLPESMREALIVLIPKPGKNPQECESYRPISLINSDVKILAKVLAGRLTSVILKLINLDQTGFILGRCTQMNLRRLYVNLQVEHTNTGERAITSLDTKKALDSVEWDYLFSLLSKMGFGPRFVSWVKLLYTNPQACIRINGLISNTFKIYRGTRQGCPLSPLLFALAIEPLATKIGTHTTIKGLLVGNLEERVSLYADDMLLYLGDSAESLLAAVSLIREFGDFSGFRINWHKSAFLFFFIF